MSDHRGIFAYKEERSENPRAVVGLTDTSARANVRKQLEKGLLSFSVPWKMFQEMEINVEGGFLQKEPGKFFSEKNKIRKIESGG